MSIADVLPQSDARSTRGRVPVYNVLLNGVTMDVTPISATMSLTNGEHDSVSLAVTSSAMQDTEGLVTSTISFRWGVAPRAETFNGYIVSVEEQSGATGALTFTMSILGSTKVMYEGTPQFLSYKSVTSAVRDTVHRNLLGYIGHDHEYPWTALAQTEESDWEIINDWAERLGWLILNRYGVVMCYDPFKLYVESGPYARLVMGSSFDPNSDRNLIDFQPSEKSDVLKENLGKKFGYFTTSGAVQVATQPGEYEGYVFSTDAVIDNQDAATVYTSAADVDMDSWKQFALARCWGDADFYPGMCVEVVTSNRRYLKTKYDGKWLIRAVLHNMDRQQFQTMLYLTRPASTTRVSVSAYIPFWNDDATGRARPTLSIMDERWVSSWADRRARSVV
jgi:hypothetical protein